MVVVTTTATGVQRVMDEGRAEVLGAFGRPPAPTSAPLEAVAVRIPAVQLAAIDELARAGSCRRSAVLQRAITEFLERQEATEC